MLVAGLLGAAACRAWRLQVSTCCSQAACLAAAMKLLLLAWHRNWRLLVKQLLHGCPAAWDASLAPGRATRGDADPTLHAPGLLDVVWMQAGVLLAAATIPAGLAAACAGGAVLRCAPRPGGSELRGVLGRARGQHSRGVHQEQHVAVPRPSRRESVRTGGCHACASQRQHGTCRRTRVAQLRLWVMPTGSCVAAAITRTARHAPALIDTPRRQQCPLDYDGYHIGCGGGFTDPTCLMVPPAGICRLEPIVLHCSLPFPGHPHAGSLVAVGGGSDIGQYSGRAATLLPAGCLGACAGKASCACMMLSPVCHARDVWQGSRRAATQYWWQGEGRATPPSTRSPCAASHTRSWPWVLPSSW